jgi:hypothetical protein
MVIVASITDEAVGQLKLAKGQKALCGHQGAGSDGRRLRRADPANYVLADDAMAGPLMPTTPRKDSSRYT